MLHIHPKVVKTFRTLLFDDIFLCLFLKGENKLPVSLGTDNKIQNRILFFPYQSLDWNSFIQKYIKKRCLIKQKRTRQKSLPEQRQANI
ncbi:MAG: hypothetical protein D3915_04740 [Candidatus Electrothrix sp. AU1_5]|nr:hypothetical protein [Candidatus Electrothrix gigas]